MKLFCGLTPCSNFPNYLVSQILRKPCRQCHTLFFKLSQTSRPRKTRPQGIGGDGKLPHRISSSFLPLPIFTLFLKSLINEDLNQLGLLTFFDGLQTKGNPHSKGGIFFTSRSQSFGQGGDLVFHLAFEPLSKSHPLHLESPPQNHPHLEKLVQQRRPLTMSFMQGVQRKNG